MSAMACEACGDLVRVDGDLRRKRIYCSELCKATSVRASRRGSLLERACAQCGSSMSGRSDQRYCSVSCRLAARHADSEPEGTSTQTEADRELALVNDLTLYVGQIGISRLTAQLTPESKQSVIEALDDAANSLRRQLWM